MEYNHITTIARESTEDYTEYCRQDALDRSSKIAALLIEQATRED